MERPQQNSTNALLLAPVHAVGETPDSVYEYIKKQHAIKNDYEMGRLLYVAATRAKKYLHCFFNLQSSEASHVAKPLSKSLLEKLWLSIETETMKNLIYCRTPDKKTEEPTHPRLINRLTLDWKNPITELNPLEQVTFHNKSMGFLLPNYTAKKLGVIIHKILEHISVSNLIGWSDIPISDKKQYLQTYLIQAGILIYEIESASNYIINAINNTLNDAQGRWILKNHKESQSEFHVTTIIENKIYSLIIDRTFVDENDIRWIIDFKTSTPNNESLAVFLDKEQAKYSQQLQLYMQAMRQLDTRPIKIGLYFPLVPAWYECSS